MLVAESMGRVGDHGPVLVGRGMRWKAQSIGEGAACQPLVQDCKNDCKTSVGREDVRASESSVGAPPAPPYCCLAEATG